MAFEGVHFSALSRECTHVRIHKQCAAIESFDDGERMNLHLLGLFCYVARHGSASYFLLLAVCRPGPPYRVAAQTETLAPVSA